MGVTSSSIFATNQALKDPFFDKQTSLRSVPQRQKLHQHPISYL
ncbi:hypothetical protein VCR29J2_680152 [Vibrio coralliirubri]|nr:hypothetical protein VCR29J2_680152 [Vibrio coralliirubri]